MLREAAPTRRPLPRLLVLSALVMIAVSAAIAAQFGKMLGDPMSMMPA